MPVEEPDRAVAVVVRAGRVLAIDRYLRQPGASACVMCGFQLDLRSGACPGHRYTVLPGGGVEPGESPAEAAVRELREESTLSATAGRLLHTSSHNGRRALYFEMENVTGEPALSGPELEAHGPENSFALVWLTPADLDDRVIYPEDVPEFLRSHPALAAGGH